ncbi:MAG TPA: hypothetical protein VM409_03065 [Chloroflexia bacterium]|nr:hypothetical protein [Chloroflexia bacterium]
MTRRTWSVVLDDRTYSIELDHGYWSGTQKVFVDGQLAFERGVSPFRWFSTASVPVGRHTATIVIRPNLAGINYIYDLAIDEGPTLGSNEYVKPALPTPFWAWLFIPLNGSIGIWIALVTRDPRIPHVIPHLIAVHGAVRCYYFLIDKTVSPEERVSKCRFLTLVTMALALLVVLAFFLFA